MGFGQQLTEDGLDLFAELESQVPWRNDTEDEAVNRPFEGVHPLDGAGIRSEMRRRSEARAARDWTRRASARASSRPWSVMV